VGKSLVGWSFLLYFFHSIGCIPPHVPSTLSLHHLGLSILLRISILLSTSTIAVASHSTSQHGLQGIAFRRHGFSPALRGSFMPQGTIYDADEFLIVLENVDDNSIARYGWDMIPGVDVLMFGRNFSPFSISALLSRTLGLEIPPFLIYPISFL